MGFQAEITQTNRLLRAPYSSSYGIEVFGKRVNVEVINDPSNTFSQFEDKTGRSVRPIILDVLKQTVPELYPVLAGRYNNAQITTSAGLDHNRVFNRTQLQILSIDSSIVGMSSTNLVLSGQGSAKYLDLSPISKMPFHMLRPDVYEHDLIGRILIDHIAEGLSLYWAEKGDGADLGIFAITRDPILVHQMARFMREWQYDSALGGNVTVESWQGQHDALKHLFNLQDRQMKDNEWLIRDFYTDDIKTSIVSGTALTHGLVHGFNTYFDSMKSRKHLEEAYMFFGYVDLGRFLQVADYYSQKTNYSERMSNFLSRVRNYLRY